MAVVVVGRAGLAVVTKVLAAIALVIWIPLVGPAVIANALATRASTHMIVAVMIPPLPPPSGRVVPVQRVVARLIIVTIVLLKSAESRLLHCTASSTKPHVLSSVRRFIPPKAGHTDGAPPLLCADRAMSRGFRTMLQEWGLRAS